MTRTNIIIAQPSSFSHVIRRVDLCCCYCCPGRAAVAAAPDSINYAALSSLSCSSLTIIQTYLPSLNNSGQATSRGNYSRQQATRDATMMETMVTDDSLLLLEK
jgi:hypothetical protein